MTKITDPCPQCGAQLSFDLVDTYGLGTPHKMPRCEACFWHPGAVKVPCECGCGKMSFDARLEFNHPEDYRYERG